MEVGNNIYKPSQWTFLSFALKITFSILFPEWVPGSENETADWISKYLDKDDYMLNPNIFAVADILWGPHTIDHFSSFKTRQVPRFCSEPLHGAFTL